MYLVAEMSTNLNFIDPTVPHVWVEPRTLLALHGTVDMSKEPTELLELPRKHVEGKSLPRLIGFRRTCRLEILAADELTLDQFDAAWTPQFSGALLEKREWARGENVLARFHGSMVDDETDEKLLVELVHVARARLGRRQQKVSLRIRRLALQNFRGVSALDIELSPRQTTLLVGVNGSGKTTVLDAAALLLSFFAIRMRGGSDPTLTERDIKNDQMEAKIEIEAEIDGEPVAWAIDHAREAARMSYAQPSGLSALNERVRRLRDQKHRGDVHVPIAVQYPVNRAVLEIPVERRGRRLLRNEPRDPYEAGLVRTQRSFREFFEWFREREDLENQQRIHDSAYRDHQLEAVRRAIVSLMPGYADPHVDRVTNGMLVTKGNSAVYIDQLSDGEKCLFAMVGDLARRLAMANPYMDNPLEGGGVVLIDEIELHLHPGWQRAIIPALERTFPNCQFIVTTHSPTVLGHVDRDSVFVLVPEGLNITATHPRMSRGLDANRVLLELMGVDERPSDVKHRIEQIYSLLGSGKLAEARVEIAALEGEIGSDPELTKAETIIRRKEILGK